MKVVALAGGVGGAKLADGLAACLPNQDLTVIVNTGDDFEHLGLHISPDLDTVCYTLAGMANPATGWGRADESWMAMESLAALGGPTWFKLGDRDLGLHLERTRRLQRGDPLSQVTRDFCHAWGIKISVLPMSDDPMPTHVLTDEGDLPFQEYFVHRQCQPRVNGFRFDGSQQARPAPGMLETLQSADLIVICPSNPWVSIDPILSVPGVRAAVQTSSAPVIAISPIIAGQAVKGPAAKMYAELGLEPSAGAVAQHYRPLLTDFILDNLDSEQQAGLQADGLRVWALDTYMQTRSDRLRLAEEIIRLGERFMV